MIAGCATIKWFPGTPPEEIYTSKKINALTMKFNLDETYSVKKGTSVTLIPPLERVDSNGCHIIPEAFGQNSSITYKYSDSIVLKQEPLYSGRFKGHFCSLLIDHMDSVSFNSFTLNLSEVDYQTVEGSKVWIYYGGGK